jgi:hypothetical protein
MKKRVLSFKTLKFWLLLKTTTDFYQKFPEDLIEIIEQKFRVLLCCFCYVDWLISRIFFKNKILMKKQSFFWKYLSLEVQYFYVKRKFLNGWNSQRIKEIEVWVESLLNVHLKFRIAYFIYIITPKCTISRFDRNSCTFAI